MGFHQIAPNSETLSQTFTRNLKSIPGYSLGSNQVYNSICLRGEAGEHNKVGPYRTKR